MSSFYSFQREEYLFIYQKDHHEHRTGTIIGGTSGCVTEIRDALSTCMMVNPKYKRRGLSKSKVRL